MNIPEKIMAIRPMRSNLRRPSRQRGVTTLAIALLLLAILTIITLLSLSTGFFEQRTAINENRSKLAAHASETGVQQGMEFFRANSRDLLTNWLYPPTAVTQRRWVLCGATDTSFPCGAEPNQNRRSRSYRYQEPGTGNLFINFGAAPFQGTQAVAAMGNFSVAYQAGALLCMVNPDTGTCDCRQEDGATCGLDNTKLFAGPMAITIVSRSTLDVGGQVEGGRGTVKATMASFRTIPNPPDVPIIASGYIDGSGNVDVVPNPNAAGFGIPLSIWAQGESRIVEGGAMDTCHRGEFMASGSPVLFQNVQTCSDCRCQNLPWGKGKISGHKGAIRVEGRDVLDVDGDGGEIPDSRYFPSTGTDDPNNSLDDSLFEYVFGQDVEDESGTPLMCSGISCEVKYLTDNAQAVTSCDALNSSSAGLYWYGGTGTCSLSGDIGTPNNPVVLVSNGPIVMTAARIFGVLFQRNTTTAEFSTAGRTEVYGAVVVDGLVNLRGQPAFIYDETVLNNVSTSPAFTRYGLVAGSWSDLDSF
jgi:Tfp pilus assembly protein PilX